MQSTKVDDEHRIRYQTQAFVWFSTLIFPFYEKLFTSRFEFSRFTDFLYGMYF
jgi:hypothetical protein